MSYFGIKVYNLQPGTIVSIVEIVFFFVIVFALLTGKLIGRRTQNPSRSLLGVSAAAIGLNVVLLAVTQSTAARFGTIVTRQTALFGVTLAIALLGGCASGVARQREGKGAVMAISLLTGVLAGVGIMMFIARVNDVMELLKDVGLLQSGQKYEPEKNKDCPENLKSLYIAFQMYARDWDALPPAANWLDNDELVSKVSRNEWLHCPAVSDRHDAKYGYAYNDSAAGMKLNGKHNLADLPNAAKTPLLYDSTNLAKSAHDAMHSLPKPGRHGGRNNILYLDGHVQAVAP